ncbi:MAG TPA: nitrilase-related carbon-nitrogen hydrolase [Phycisphaerae bacterium]|nr:nitrilase-related carbon-nitrogen hydrolase [Phycisphaerae bacterium]HRR87589.1 nitrilase-related carbon-nitrogen hydrolase [Phycisphaerae bacterium]
MMRRYRFLLMATAVATLLWVTGCDAGRGAGGSAVKPVRTLTVAAVSCESRIHEVEFNLSRIEHWARQAAAAGADIALFPETGISGWWASREVRAFAEPIDGPAITRLTKVADELGIVLAVGMTERDGDKAHITHVVIDGRGVIGMHRKTSLAPGEEKTWDPGSDANVFEVKGIRVGIAICFESVHPPTCARLRENGAEIILAPYANGTDPDELLNGKRPYPYERAKENQVWYVACDAPARDEQKNLRRGAAYVISPEGELKAITAPDAVGETMVLYTIRLS